MRAPWLLVEQSLACLRVTPHGVSVGLAAGQPDVGRAATAPPPAAAPAQAAASSPAGTHAAGTAAAALTADVPPASHGGSSSRWRSGLHGGGPPVAAAVGAHEPAGRRCARAGTRETGAEARPAQRQGRRTWHTWLGPVLQHCCCRQAGTADLTHEGQHRPWLCSLQQRHVSWCVCVSAGSMEALPVWFQCSVHVKGLKPSSGH